jgi:hypothetical protein
LQAHFSFHNANKLKLSIAMSVVLACNVSSAFAQEVDNNYSPAELRTEKLVDPGSSPAAIDNEKTSDISNVGADEQTAAQHSVPPPLENSAPSLTSLEKTTNDIVKLQIQLMKLSTNFHMTWFTPGKGKSWRYFAYRMADSSLTNAGMICIAASRFNYINNPSQAPRPFLKSGHIINLIGASIIVGGTLTESVIDKVHDKRLAKQGLSLESSLENFRAVLTKLDDLLEQRKAQATLCTELTATQKSIIEADGLVLKDIRDLTCAEFAHSYCDVVRLRAKRDIGNGAALFGAATAGYMGSLQSLLSVANRQPKQIGVAGTGFITSGASVVAAPLITKYGGDYFSKRAEKKLDGIILDDNEAARARFDQNRQRLESLIASASADDTEVLKALSARQAVYSLKNKMFDSRHEFRVHHRITAKRELLERQFFASIIGGTNIARGSQLAVAGFKHYDNSRNIFRLVTSASVCFIAGTGVWSFDNVQVKAREEIAKSKLKNAKLSVEARLADDLDSLEDMEDRMSLF